MRTMLLNEWMWVGAAVLALLAGALVAAALRGDRVFSWAMHSLGAKPLRYEDAPALHQEVALLAIAARIPRPRLYLLERGTPAAFTLGWGRTDARLVLTRGALESVDPKERSSLLAHEVAHISIGHIRRTTSFALAALAAEVASARVQRWLHRCGTPLRRVLAADALAAELLDARVHLAALERARSGTANAPRWETAGAAEGRRLLERRIARLRAVTESLDRRAEGIVLRRGRGRGRFFPRRPPHADRGARQRPRARR